MAIITIVILSSSALAMQRAQVPRKRHELAIIQEDPAAQLKTNVLQSIENAHSFLEADNAGKFLADMVIKFQLPWAWKLLYQLIESPGLNEIESDKRACRRNIGSFALAYLNRAKLSCDYTVSLLAGPDLEENMAALRAISYGKRMGCPWAHLNQLPHAKADDLWPRLSLIDASLNVFISTDEILSRTQRP